MRSAKATRVAPIIALAMIASSCTVWTWGYNGFGQLGNGTTVDSSSPVSLGQDFFAVSAGADHTCRISDSRTLECWGNNQQGQLGDGTTTDRSSPTSVGSAANWSTVSAGGTALFINSSATCGTRTTGSLWCWGDGLFGQLGLGNTADQLTPAQVGSATDWTEVSVGGSGACGLRGSRGFLWCWGSQVPGSTSTVTSPLQIGTSDGWLDVEMGLQHGCVILDPGELYCWGENEDGQIGDGTTSDRRSPVRVGTERDWIRLGLGAAHTCGIRANGSLWCWGSNTDGQLGDGTTTERHTPVQVGSATDWSWITAGGNRFPPPLYVESGHTCGIRAGDLYCWGDNLSGQLGDGTTTDRHTPTQVGIGKVWVTVDAGRSHTSAQEY